MHAADRCERPETVFVWVRAVGEVVGVTADSVEFARVLLGPQGDRLPGWPLTGRAEEWAERLKLAKERACSDAARAIAIWLRRRGIA